MYLTESMQTDWLYILDEYWEEILHPTQMILNSGMSGCFNV